MTSEVLYITALTMGLLGSLHCMGMCGPIVLVLHGKRPFLSKLSYHAGRIGIYSFIGILIGFSGGALRLAASQEAISIIAGILMLLMIVVPSRLMSRLPILRSFGTFYSVIQQKTQSFWKERTVKGDFLLGMINGLLPCGFLYAAFLGSLNGGSISGSALWMLLFGIGTIPSLLFIGSLSSFKNQTFQRYVQNALPIGTAIIAVIFILRGLSLGIPMISPILPDQIPSVEAPLNLHQEHTCCSPKH
jgi:sulfite exporter TauE/SafE